MCDNKLVNKCIIVITKIISKLMSSTHCDTSIFLHVIHVFILTLAVIQFVMNCFFFIDSLLCWVPNFRSGNAEFTVDREIHHSRPHCKFNVISKQIPLYVEFFQYVWYSILMNFLRNFAWRFLINFYKIWETSYLCLFSLLLCFFVLASIICSCPVCHL